MRRYGSEFLIVLQRIGSQIKQPAAHDGAVAPQFGELREVEVEFLLVLQEIEALGERLHHSVLDAVVQHLRVMPGADRADVRPAAIGCRRQRLQHWRHDRRDFLAAADHQAIAVVEAPDAA